MNHNHYVPDFELIDGSGHPASTSLTRPNKSAATSAEEDMMELLWQDGQVVFQSQNQRSQRKPNNIGDIIDAINIMPAQRQIRQDEETAASLFIQEDEMATWLHYPALDDSTPFDRDLYEHIIFYPPNCTPAAPPLSACPGPVLADNLKSEFKPPTEPVHNFTHFSRCRGMAEQGAGGGGPSISNKTMAKQMTVVDSSETPALGKAPESRISHVSSSTINVSARTIGPALGILSTAAGESDAGTCDFTVSSSPGGSAASASMSVEPKTPKPAPPVMEDRKRKGRAAAAADQCQNEGIDVGAKKRARGSTSTKKSRAAEVHNLSERKRRDRINEKMKALQELIPRCNKSDKASMLDEAIEYLKSLQLQVQMMSMGCTMVPMMFPGIQHYMPTVGMGIGMGIGPGMGMTRPMMQFPQAHVHPGSTVQCQPSTSHMAPRFPTPAFPLPVPSGPGPAIPDSNVRIQPTNLPHNSMMNSAATQNLRHPQMQNVVNDPYQQYLNTNQFQASLLAQNPTVMQISNPSEPGCSDVSNHGNLQSG